MPGTLSLPTDNSEPISQFLSVRHFGVITRKLPQVSRKAVTGFSQFGLACSLVSLPLSHFLALSISKTAGQRA